MIATQWIAVIIFATAAATLVFLAWLVKSRTRLPSTFRIQQMDSGQEDPGVADALSGYDEAFASLGFEKAGDFMVAGGEPENLHRVFINSKETSYGIVSLVSAGFRRRPHLEFYTRFSDQSLLSTDQALSPSFMAVPPGREQHRLSAGANLIQLWEFHKKRMDALRGQNRAPLPVSKDTINQDLVRDQQELIDFQVKSGLFSLDPEAAALIPTWKFAFYFLFKVFDPIPFGVSNARLLSGIIIAAVILFGFFSLARWPELERISQGLSLSLIQVRYLISCAGAVAAGILVGYTIERRGILWAGIISLAEFPLIMNSFPNAIIIILIGAYAGLVGNRIFERKINRMVTRFAGPLLVLAGLIIIGWTLLEKR